MWLVAGLGNPGAKYERNRHNIGFRVVDELARSHGLSWKSGKLGGDVATGMLGRDKIVLVKPMEFMNLSGFAVQRTADFHEVPVENILVVHDEIDLPFGVVRLKNGGGHGGHNGLRSIQEQLGEAGFARLRMGVGRDPNAQPGAPKEARPEEPKARTRGKNDAAGWVLSDFPAAVASVVTAMISAGCEDIEAVIAKGIVPAMNQHNARPSFAPA